MEGIARFRTGRPRLHSAAAFVMSNRRQQLEAFLEQHPDDAFARYGLAMELSQSGDSGAALEQFRRIRERHPDYVPALQQTAILLLAQGRGAEAKPVLEQGIAAARRQGNLHATRELEGLLAEIE